MLPLKTRVNRDKCSFATKQRMFGVFAIDEILRYRGTRFPGSRTLCHPALKVEEEDFNNIRITNILLTSELVDVGQHIRIRLKLLFPERSENVFLAGFCTYNDHPR